MTKYHFNSIYKNDETESTGLLFIKVYNKWESNLKRVLKSVGLTLPQFIVLTSLLFLNNREEYVTQVDIARFTGMDVMTVSQIVRLLEKKDYIRRDQHPKDSRAKLVSVTKSGAEKVNQALPLVEGIDEKFFEKLSNDRESFNRMLAVLEDKNA